MPYTVTLDCAQTVLAVIAHKTPMGIAALFMNSPGKAWVGIDVGEVPPTESCLGIYG
jgi:hypothetical protein